MLFRLEISAVVSGLKLVNPVRAARSIEGILDMANASSI
jgi:hypothetical protein